jgi:hypothetical protein
VYHKREHASVSMADLISIEWFEQAPDSGPGGGSRQQPDASACDAEATVSIEPEEFRAELACGNPQAAPEPYEEGFGAYLAGRGLPDNPYPPDHCGHGHWANGWSQARDEAQRQARH